MRFSLLGSGSSGNALLVTSPTGSILIDNGLSFRQLERRARGLGETLDDLRAVFITHEHGDHVNGVGVLTRKRDVPVYMTEQTRECLPRGVGRIPRVKLFESGETIALNGFSLSSFNVSHDAKDPVSYVVRYGDSQLGIATDLGSASQLVRTQLAGSHALVLESNYCPDMLRNSSYPAAICQRIRSNQGHLSNNEMNSLLSDLIHADLELVVAVHVSKENNTEEKARTMATRALGTHHAKLVIAQQDEPTPLYAVRENVSKAANA